MEINNKLSMDIYEKPSLCVIDIQTEGSILSASDPNFGLYNDQTDEWS